MNRGFTLLEVLVSLLILSMIAIISSNILQSSLDLERSSTKKISEVSNLYFSSILIRRDIRQIVNVPLRDYFGNQIDGSFKGSNLNKNITFNTKINSVSNQASPIKRIEYTLLRDQFIRKQFYSSNPYNRDEFVSTQIIKNVSDFELSFLYEKKWYSDWPLDKKTQNKIPLLIKLEFKQDKKSYIWIIEPNITYEF